MPKVLNRRHSGVPEGAVYVGRPTKWGNPYSLTEYRRSDSICEYRNWLALILESDPHFLDELRGKDLVCWCAPKRCHADILLREANKEVHGVSS